jgi:hypothetical protein
MLRNSPNSARERTITHIYVRDAQNHYLRPCWSDGAQIYCGMCLLAVIKPQVDAVCSSCFSRVDRILEVDGGGRPQSARV